MRAKILFQSTWLRGLDWDTPLDDAGILLWRDFQVKLPRLEEIRVPRSLLLGGSRGAIEFHGFADASERAYAAVLYVRADSGDSGRQVRIIMAKTKVAFLKQVILPHLELCAATLLVRLDAHVRRILRVSETPIHLWSDSTVALDWIQGHSSRWKTYVANRVTDIQTTMSEAIWHHLPGRDNPADCASRGVLPSDLVNHPLWWRGPSWLSTSEDPWPVPPFPDQNWDSDLMEERFRILLIMTQRIRVEEPEELMQFSSLHCLLRVTAWCRRWLGGRGSAGRVAGVEAQPALPL
ncbi:uncharacterized protein LOC116852728 [Odontomachus brunneus]|uniref:uncharacterized protein LOC116852728 n=1 Tax=Odontomachus brunneus TaxID=486640 RepID=UPI0013F23834|nr:uncharacterized protein LOC116852728 [Odontomachus brunneus]